MGDETSDISNKEQLVLCMRWVDDDFQIHQDFRGIHHIPNTSADENLSHKDNKGLENVSFWEVRTCFVVF